MVSILKGMSIYNNTCQQLIENGTKDVKHRNNTMDIEKYTDRHRVKGHRCNSSARLSASIASGEALSGSAT